MRRLNVLRLVAGTLLYSLGALLSLSGCRGSEPTQDVDGTSATRLGEEQAQGTPRLAPPSFPTGVLRLYTSPAGSRVLLNGYPVLDDAGEAVLTPCLLTAPLGTHTLTVIQPGKIDLSREVRFSDRGEHELDLDFSGVPDGVSVSLSAPLMHLSPGERVPLTTLNTPFREADPHLSTDGRTLWFASDRPEGRGIYVAVRSSTLHDFGPAELVTLSKSREGACSPSLMDDGSLVFLTLGAARAWRLVRSSPLGPFQDKEPLAHRDQADLVWTSGQITGDGLRFYFVQQMGEQSEARVVLREEAHKPFNNELRIELPGGHPHLSADGLRQHMYDGRVLSRARRASIGSRFSQIEPVCEVVLDHFQPSPDQRQYCVSEDEQWLIYCDDSRQQGDLYLVRLSLGPQWGARVTASTIPPRAIPATSGESGLAEVHPPEDDWFDPEPSRPNLQARPEDEQPLFDPLLTDYALHRELTSALLRSGNIDQAQEHIAAGLASPELTGAQEALQYDLEDLQTIDRFWQLADRGAASLAPGETILVQRVEQEIIRYADREFTIRVGAQSRTIPLHQVDLGRLLHLAERTGDPSAEAGWLTLLMYAPDYPARSRDRRLQDSETGRTLIEREAARLLTRARSAIQSGQVVQGLSLLDQLEAQYGGTSASERVEEIRILQYDSTSWTVVGERNWERGPLGEWTARPGRSAGSWLQSPRPYRRFQLSMEYRTTDPIGQGGVFFRYRGEGRIDRDTFKIQLTNDAGLNPDVYCTGSLFGVERPRRNMARPLGDWNSFLMEVDGERLKVTLNGEVVLDTLAVENVIPLSGYVAMDGISGGISYRKIVLSGEE